MCVYVFRSLPNSSFGVFLEVTTLRQLVVLPSWIASPISDAIFRAREREREKEATLGEIDAEQNRSRTVRVNRTPPERIISYRISIQSSTGEVLFFLFSPPLPLS